MILFFSPRLTGGRAAAEALPDTGLEALPDAASEISAVGTETAAPGEDKDRIRFYKEDPPDYDWFISDSSLVYGGWQNYEPVTELMGDNYKGLFVYALEGDVYCFAELLQDEEVMSFLILGDDRALMWDTGLGMFDTRALAEKITDLPITVLNSHEHPDHIGGNHLFEEVYCYNAESAVNQLTRGMSHEELTGMIRYNTYVGVAPEGYDPQTISIPAKAPAGVVEDGQIIDLGGRELEVMHTPGHTFASIMLFDEANGILFTGDMFYPGPIYLAFEDSSLQEYIASMQKATERAKELGIAHIYCSHNALVEGLDMMAGFTDWCEDVLAGKVKGITGTEYGITMQVYEYEDNLSLWMTDFAAAK